MNPKKTWPRCLSLGFLVAIFIGFLTSHKAYGVASQRGQIRVHYFPVPHQLRGALHFWEAIFHKYPSHVAVIHDTYHPEVIVDVINFKAFAKKFRGDAPYNRKERNQLVTRYIKRYRKAIDRFAKIGKDAITYGAMEKRIFNVYSKNRIALKKMLKGKAQIRSQTGLKDKYDNAAIIAKDYLPYMEHIFRKANLPIDLVKMVFVESMFNVKARSKVGASGVWQFMPRTGRLYMTVNNWIDERNSPLKATKAAAKLLKENYQILRSWPLAITAYNHGASGLKRAVRKFRTRDFGIIATKYRSKNFGFASRNFYVEFVAARNVYNRYHKPPSLAPNPMKISKIRLKNRTSLSSLIKNTPLTEHVIKKHNLCLKQKAFKNYRKRLLPRNFELIVPDHLVKKTRKSLATYSKPKKPRGRL